MATTANGNFVGSFGAIYLFDSVILAQFKDAYTPRAGKNPSDLSLWSAICFQRRFNAGITNPNPGLNVQMLTVSYRF